MDSMQILEKLIAFPTVSRDSNLDLIGYVSDLLAAQGIVCQIIRSADGHKANLFATIGPADAPGVMLSGHTDVVPIDGQDWTLPPFEMTARDSKLYGGRHEGFRRLRACRVPQGRENEPANALASGAFL
jgi:acetylornithine deacetylase